MPLDALTIFSFFLVFVRCSGMMIAAPLFGAMNAPVSVRVYATLAISLSLTFVIRPSLGPIPTDMWSLALAVGNEAVAGLLIGSFFSLVLHAATMAGAIADLSLGLGLSQALNPITGVPVSVVAQFKYLLCLIVFLQLDAHHLMLGSFVQSYHTLPTINEAMMGGLKSSLVDLVGSMTLLALQMAAPIAAVSFVVDAGLGLVNRAVPQMPALLVGLPAKVLMGLIAMSVGLPALVGTVQQGVERTTGAIGRMLPAR